MTTPTPNNVSAEQISDASIDNTGPTPSRNNAMNDATTTTISMNTNTSDSTHLMPSNQAITSLGGAGGVSTTGAGGGSGPGITDPTEPTGLLPPGAPIPRKDRNLREFLGMMDEYAPIIPDAVTDYYLAISGLSTSDIRLKRLLALATQKFISDIAADAYQYSRIRSNTSSNANSGAFPTAAGGMMLGSAGGGAGSGGTSGGALRPMPRPGFGGAGGSAGTAGRQVLTMEDLGAAVAEYGVNTRRPEFYR